MSKNSDAGKSKTHARSSSKNSSTGNTSLRPKPVKKHNAKK